MAQAAPIYSLPLSLDALVEKAAEKITLNGLTQIEAARSCTCDIAVLPKDDLVQLAVEGLAARLYRYSNRDRRRPVSDKYIQQVKQDLEKLEPIIEEDVQKLQALGFFAKDMKPEKMADRVRGEYARSNLKPTQCTLKQRQEFLDNLVERESKQAAKKFAKDVACARIFKTQKEYEVQELAERRAREMLGNIRYANCENKEVTWLQFGLLDLEKLDTKFEREQDGISKRRRLIKESRNLLVKHNKCRVGELPVEALIVLANIASDFKS